MDTISTCSLSFCREIVISV